MPARTLALKLDPTTGKPARRGVPARTLALKLDPTTGKPAPHRLADGMKLAKAGKQ